MTGLRPGPAWTLSVPGASQDLWTAGKGAGLALASALGLQRTRAKPSSSASRLSRAPTKSKLLRSFGLSAERKGTDKVEAGPGRRPGLGKAPVS